ncbi:MULTISPECIES: flagellar hook protein FlgE [Leifsonia]|uniref:Flagellar hook protein FlgE n=3 Tax=Leifsonia TaxID=110932 RepID=U2RMI3_LEIAQ|nr:MULTISPECIES: flagellar hook protein FlgE [Leifsonia]ERK69789.1 flagellar hook-basal body protein [Leifsonia aquatica ATCC 14665]MBB2967623.1 flagellar hook protein FlgE [Leifsonia aquatica]NYK09866.1 flagellar hook protein FlgE [Leifsonia naganoensis]
MLRSLYSGISGLRSHQTMLDVTGNNIANVNTTAFKSSAVQFQDTLSQLVQGAGGPQAQTGGTNPAQIGLGVLVAGISTNFTQGAAQATGRSTDMMINGDGFFVTNVGGETVYTRAGSFDPDALGRLVGPGGAILQGYNAVNGVIQQGGALSDITIPLKAVTPAAASTSANVNGNLPSDAAVGDQLVRDISVYDANGTERKLTLTFTKSATGWDVAGTDGTANATGALTFTNGVLTAGGALTVGGVNVNLSTVTGYSGLSTVAFKDQNGRAAGTLESFTLSKDGTIIGLFSNGDKQAVARIALATFVNPGGLEKAGGSTYRATVNSGAAQVGGPGEDGLGNIQGGSLEMSNVDLSQEFTNLIVAQRGFQANARIITTSDEVLQELTNLKR